MSAPFVRVSFPYYSMPDIYWHVLTWACILPAQFPETTFHQCGCEICAEAMAFWVAEDVTAAMRGARRAHGPFQDINVRAGWPGGPPATWKDIT